MRLFIAVELPQQVRAQVVALEEKARALAPGARFVSEDKLHLTLVFLKELVDEKVLAVEALVAQVAARHPPLSLRLRGAGGFPSKRKPRVLWLGIEGDVAPVGQMRAELEAGLAPLGHEPEHRAFTPHLTLARAKKLYGDPALAGCVEALSSVDLGPVRVETLVLFRSQLSPKGATHTALVRAPLR